MCCSWRIVVGSGGSSSADSRDDDGGACAGSIVSKKYQDMSSASNAVLAEHMKQKIRRDLSRWSRKLLLCLGLENIGKHIVGDSKWEKLYDGCPSSSSTAEQDHEDGGADFEPQVRNDTSPRSGGKSPNALDAIPAALPSVDVSGGEEEGDDDPVGRESDPTGENEKAKDIGEEGVHENGSEEGNVIDDEEEYEEQREEKVEGEATERDEVNRVANISPNHSSKHSDKMEDGELEMERGMAENDEDSDVNKGNLSGPQSPMSTTSPSIHAGLSSLMERATESPQSGSEAAQSTEEKGSGGALVDNLFQILPYWYFLNRAFGMSGGRDGSVPLDPSLLDGPGDVEDEDDDGGGSSPVDGGGGQDSGRGSASSPFAGVGPQSSATSQRINSLLLLESLRQQIQTQGQQGVLSQEQTLQQQLQISELLSRMSAGGGSEGRGSSAWSALPRGHLPIIPDNHHANNNNLPVSSEQPDIDDQPLDLTSCRGSKDEEKEVGSFVEYSPGGGSSASLNHLRNNTSPFVLDEQTSKVFRSNPRSSKGYTAQELQAALHDIQSGKLGTRRAAVIYGIPRSTLRNKVYKLGKDRGRLFNSTGAITNPTLPHLNNNTINNNNNNTSAKDATGNASLLNKLSYFHGLSASSYLSGGGVGRGGTAPPSSRYSNMDEEDGDEPPPPPSAFLGRRAPPSLYAMGNGDVSPPKQLATHHHVPHQSSLSQLISKHAHPRTAYHQAFQGSPMDVAMMEESSCHSDDQGPAGSQLLSHKDSWKFALARHQEQQQQQLLSQQQRQSVTGGNHYQRQLTHQQQVQQNHGDDASSSLDLGKKSRPKRGKYRNYDREALIKAVRAVQNGEMSVHRAGSFFGVPHSTLEYKVKERHLLRRPKRKDVTSPLSQAKSSSPESSSQDASTPNNAPRHGAFSKVPPSGKSLINNNNNNNSSGESGGLQHPYLFPLTSDLRESLSRYLNQENNKDDDRASSSEIMDTGGSSHHHEDDDEEEEESPRENHRLHHQLTQKSTSSGKSGAAAMSLEGLIGNRLSNLFQLNDILLRSGSAGGAGGAGEGRPESLLDLTKK